MCVGKTVRSIKKMLTDSNCTLKIAESFTGGYISSCITCLKGASEYFTESLVVYSNKAKTMRLGVDEAVIKAFGAVSCATVCKMLKGLLNSGCDYAIATSGNASESSEGQSKKGECYVGVASKNQIIILYYVGKGSRKKLIKMGAYIALKELEKLIKKS